MKLYHGSNQIIKEIDLKKSHPNKDFGQAFYLSEEYIQAEEMAKFKVVIEGGTPVVNEFYFDEELLNGNELHICRFDGYSNGLILYLSIEMSTISRNIIMILYMDRLPMIGLVAKSRILKRAIFLLMSF